ncbi:MAG: hypothetical protein AAF330_04830 [Pseudomonadota bacterium]
MSLALDELGDGGDPPTADAPAGLSSGDNSAQGESGDRETGPSTRRTSPQPTAEETQTDTATPASAAETATGASVGATAFESLISTLNAPVDQAAARVRAERAIEEMRNLSVVEALRVVVDTSAANTTDNAGDNANGPPELEGRIMSLNRSA